MKQFKYIILLLAVCLFTACNEDSIEGLSGVFGDVTFCDFNNATVQPTEKLGKGIKSLNVAFTDANSNAMNLRFGSKEWILGDGTYILDPTAITAGSYMGTINGAEITDGNIDVNLVNNIYFISGLIKTGTGDNTKEYKVYYKGPLTFVIGEDDPEPSGYTMSIQTSAVSVFDWTTFVQTDYPDVTKYTITISDPDGKQVALLDVINSNNLKADQLTGTYDIIGDAHDPMQINGGYSMPDYGMAGGTYYLDNSGKAQYLLGGTVEITTANGINGELLFSFKGTGLNTIDLAGNSGTGSFNIQFVSYLEVKGSIYKDITIDSQILGRQMKYSVYLPEGYDGQTTLPVLYMLHGYGDDQNAWLEKGNLAALTSAAITGGEVGKMVVVMPDAMQTFYVNGFQDGLAYEDFFFNELMPTIEWMFNVGKERGKRAIGGLSMGGYGTLYYAVQHRDLFCCAYAMSPACYIDGCPNLFDLYPATPGNELPDLTMEVGTEDTSVYEMCPWLAGYIQASGLPAFEYIERPGIHDWKFWKECYPKFMRKLGNYFK